MADGVTTTPLILYYTAPRQGDLSQVRALLMEDDLVLAIDHLDENGNAPLQNACREGHEASKHNVTMLSVCD